MSRQSPMYKQTRGTIMSHLLVDFREGKASSVPAIGLQHVVNSSSIETLIEFSYNS